MPRATISPAATSLVVAVLFVVPATGCRGLLKLDDLHFDSDGGEDAHCFAACGSAECGQCPDVPLVSVPTPGGDSFEIDATEVTNAAYANFLAAGVSISQQSQECAWNTTYLPRLEWPPADADAHRPVVFVNWCDAAAYCRWAGKRLCGKIGGGSNGYNDYKDPKLDQWYAACSAGGLSTYPYGNTYDQGACNGVDYHANKTLDVAQLSACQGGYPNLYDMSGNVAEWEDACAGDTCRVRGGAFDHTSTPMLLACDGSFDAYARGADAERVGFRCCTP
jgi:formylglycine-generating enzyme required for sulfatase activity